jgi:hypothetical protein
MSKPATIASLNRAAARSEEEFVATVQAVLEEAAHERTAEFFDKMNIPRSVAGENTTESLPVFTVGADKIGSYEDEQIIGEGIQKFLERHERKVKWHATHPSAEGLDNVVLIMRTATAITLHRFERLQLLLRAKDEVTASEWAIARELMNRAYLTYRNYLDLLIGPWLESMAAFESRDKIIERLGSFYQLIDETLRSLEQHRKRIEERRLELTVIPIRETYPPVKPPNYFGDDLISVGPWSQFWHQVQSRAQHFRETSA